MLFTTSRLRRCCFPSKKAETGKQTGVLQYLGTHGGRKDESRGKDFTQVFVCLTNFYIITPPEAQNKLEELKELSLCDPESPSPWSAERCRLAWLAVQGFLIYASN